ncbi:hypothetical protein ACOMHN_049729 [Nucella lapillus]
MGAVAEGVDWISESSESAGENEIEIVASTSTVLADNGESIISGKRRRIIIITSICSSRNNNSSNRNNDNRSNSNTGK